MSDTEKDRPLNSRDIMKIFEEVSIELGIEAPRFFSSELVYDDEERTTEHVAVDEREIKSSMAKTESPTEFSESIPIISHEFDQPALPWEQSTERRREMIEAPPQSTEHHEPLIASVRASPHLNAFESTPKALEPIVGTHDAIDNRLEVSPIRRSEIDFSKIIIALTVLGVVVILYILYTSARLDLFLPKSLQYKKPFEPESFYRINPQKSKSSTERTPKASTKIYLYFLPVRTLKRKRDAMSLLKQYELQGFKGNVRSTSAPNKRGFWYDVLLGPYSTRQSAVLTADRFQTIFGFTPAIDSLPEK